jgi:hypothetical protein
VLHVSYIGIPTGDATTGRFEPAEVLRRFGGVG